MRAFSVWSPGYREQAGSSRSTSHHRASWWSSWWSSWSAWPSWTVTVGPFMPWVVPVDTFIHIIKRFSRFTLFIITNFTLHMIPTGSWSWAPEWWRTGERTAWSELSGSTRATRSEARRHQRARPGSRSRSLTEKTLTTAQLRELYVLTLDAKLRLDVAQQGRRRPGEHLKLSRGVGVAGVLGLWAGGGAELTAGGGGVVHAETWRWLAVHGCGHTQM